MHRPAINRTTNSDVGWFSRERVLALALILASGIVLYLCYRLVLPFVPALAWALALAVIAHPAHRWLRRRLPYPNLAAGLTVGAVALIVVLPVMFVTHSLVREISNYGQVVQDEWASGKWRSSLEQHPRLIPVVKWAESQFSSPERDPQRTRDNEAQDDKTVTVSENQRGSEIQPKGAASVERAASLLTQGIGSMVTGVAWLGMQLFITCLALFFFCRDRQKALDALRSLMPLSDAETDEVFSRVDDTIHATIFGSLMVALVQGGMGGLIFWLLGLPAPLLWGTVMALLAVVPVLGTFVVWAPTASFLALRGEYASALILAAWGGIAIALVDNFLYPFLIGARMQFHTLLVFIAIVGGLAVFGASGIILGPLLLSVADALLNVWQRRTAQGGTLEDCPIGDS